MSYWENLSEKFLDDLFDSSKINRITFQTQCQQNTRKNFDQYVLPYQISEEERGIVTNLKVIVTTPISGDLAIAPFPKDQLLSAFVLEEVKRVREYKEPVSQRSQKAPRSTSAKRQYDEINVPTINVQPAPLVEIKRPRTGLPKNFYEAVNPLFLEFWTMDFPMDVRYALFAKITLMNCKEFGLQTFAEHSSSLSVIKDKLQSRSYLSIDDFENDFNQLFSNILRYYPQHHEACNVALQLRETFLLRWPVIRDTFIW